MSDENNQDFREELGKAYKEIKAYYDELEGESSRAAAILAMASLEDELESLIRSKFPHDTSNTLWKKIAGPGSTPFGTFSAKVNVGRVFGFYGPKTVDALMTAAKIRNKFAHKTTVRDFDHPLVLEKCQKLAGSPYAADSIKENSSSKHIKWVYLHTVREMEENLERVRTYIPEINGSKPVQLP